MACGRVPDPDGFVLTGRGQALTIGAKHHTGDWTRVSSFDIEWHSHIARAAANPALMAMWTTAFAPLRLLFRRGAALWRPDQWRARHADLLDILRTGAPMTIEQAIRRHYLESARTVAEDVERRAAQREVSAVSRSRKRRLSLVDTPTLPRSS